MVKKSKEVNIKVAPKGGFFITAGNTEVWTSSIEHPKDPFVAWLLGQKPKPEAKSKAEAMNGNGAWTSGMDGWQPVWQGSEGQRWPSSPYGKW